MPYCHTSDRSDRGNRTCVTSLRLSPDNLPHPWAVSSGTRAKRMAALPDWHGAGLDGGGLARRVLNCAAKPLLFRSTRS
jgi:hypothetical protein